MMPERIATERLVLRPWRDDDAATLYLLAKDPHIGPEAGWPPHTCEDESREIIRNVFAHAGVYAVTLRGDDAPIGCAGLQTGALSNLPLAGGEAEVGYWMGRTHWGLGYTTEAVRALIRAFFALPGADALWCCHYDGNLRSQRVQEKCGFVPHHTDREPAHPLTGKPCAVHVSRLCRARWLETERAQGECP